MHNIDANKIRKGNFLLKFILMPKHGNKIFETIALL